MSLLIKLESQYKTAIEKLETSKEQLNKLKEDEINYKKEQRENPAITTE